MKEIPLTRGKTTLVDDEDYDYLNYHKWFAKYDSKLDGYYAVRNFRQLTDTHTGSGCSRPLVAMSRVVMNIADSKFEIDHINHNTLDNQKSNLRVVTHRVNMHNVNLKKKATSKYIGVNWMASNSAWRSELQVFGATIHLGLYNSEEDAHAAYLGAVESNLDILNAPSVDRVDTRCY